MTRHAAKVDTNQPDIVAAIREAGFYVCDTHALGNGFPDLLAVNRYGQIVLLEVKTAGGRLTEAELRFHHEYPGALYIVRSAETAIDYLNMRWET